MAVHEYFCPNCGYFDVKMGANDWAEHYAHWCKWPTGHEGLGLADWVPRMPGIEPQESKGALYHPETGKPVPHGFYNFAVDGPRGDGVFHDRAEYKSWMKREGLEETTAGNSLQSVKDMVSKAKKSDHSEG